MEDVVCEPDTSNLTDELVVEVVGVADVNTRKGCIKCKSTIDEINQHIGICTRCSMTRLDRCIEELVVKLVVRDRQTNELHTFTAFEDQIQKITGHDTAIDDVKRAEKVTTNLLNSEVFKCTYIGTIIKSVDRPERVSTDLVLKN